MKLRLIDTIERIDPHRGIRGVKVPSFEEYMMRSAMGYAEQLPESLLLGSMVQLASWLVVVSSEFSQIALPREIEEIQFASAVGPGQRVVLDLQVRGLTCDGTAYVGGRLVARLNKLQLALHPLADFENPADLRILFSEIHRPSGEASA